MAFPTRYSLKVESLSTATYIITASCIFIANIFPKSAEGIITTNPDDREVVVGQLTYFNCSSSIYDRNVDWIFYPVGASVHDRKYIYVSGELVNPNVDKFQIGRSSSGVCNLMIKTVALEDAGKYECQEDEGIGDRKSAELVVLAANPACHNLTDTNNIVGPNSCDIKPDELRLSCSVNYTGNIPPEMIWKSNDGNESLAEYVTVVNTSNSVSYSLTMTAGISMNNSSYRCETAKSVEAQYSCTSDTINVQYIFSGDLYVNKSLDNEIICSANTSQVCTYKWKWFQGDDSTTETNERILRPKKLGWHRCEATCYIKNQACTISVMESYISLPGTSDYESSSQSYVINEQRNSSSGTTIIIVVLTIVMTSLVIVVIIVYVRKKKRRQGKRLQGERRQGTADMRAKTMLMDSVPGYYRAKSELEESPQNPGTGESSGTESIEEFQQEIEAGSDFLLIVGLSDGSYVTKDVLKINLQRPSEMSNVVEVPTAMRMEATAAIYNNTVYVVGLGIYQNEIWKYKSNSGWHQCAYLDQPRQRHSVAFVDEVLYICGGFVDRDKNVLDSVEAYNSVTNTCTSVGNLILPVQNSGNCVSYKKSLYIFGGADKQYVAISDVQVYDTVQNKCHLLLKRMPSPKKLMRATLWGELVVLLGKSKCFMYHLDTEKWRVRKRFKTNVEYFGMALSNGRIYVIGGGTSKTDDYGKVAWTCRDDLRSIAIENIIENKPAEWNIHAKLPKPCLVHSLGIFNARNDADSHDLPEQCGNLASSKNSTVSLEAENTDEGQF